MPGFINIIDILTVAISGLLTPRSLCTNYDEYDSTKTRIDLFHLFVIVTTFEILLAYLRTRSWFRPDRPKVQTKASETAVLRR